MDIVFSPSVTGHTGFEPVNAGVKVLCLTAWLMPNKKRETGFEPATLALARRCSTTEPFAHKEKYI